MNKAIFKYLWWIFFVINLAAIFALWWNGSAHLLGDGPGRYIAAGRITGLLGEFCLALMLLFIGRVAFLEPLFGHDQLNKWHRYLGYGVIIFLLTHPIFLTLGYAVRNEFTWWQQFVSFLTEWENVLPALVGLVLFVVVIIFSIPAIKRLLKYENWHGLHLFTYVAFLLAIGHQTEFGDFGEKAIPTAYWYAFNFGCLGLLALYRWLRPLYLFYKHQFYIDKVVVENADICSLYIKGKDLAEYKFKAGQFANMFILSKGYYWPHPFSFSCAFNGDHLRFTIKGLGDFSKKIALLKPGTAVILDGPLGRFTAEQATTDKYLLIAGGVGVTPIMSMTEELAGASKDLAVIYAVNEKKDLVFENEFKNKTNKYYVFMSCLASDYFEGNCCGGYLSLKRLQLLVPDFKNRDVYVCGPAPMMAAVIKILKDIGVPKQQIHFEKFGY